MTLPPVLRQSHRLVLHRDPVAVPAALHLGQHRSGPAAGARDTPASAAGPGDTAEPSPDAILQCCKRCRRTTSHSVELLEQDAMARGRARAAVTFGRETGRKSCMRAINEINMRPPYHTMQKYLPLSRDSPPALPASLHLNLNVHRKCRLEIWLVFVQQSNLHNTYTYINTRHPPIYTARLSIGCLHTYIRGSHVSRIWAGALCQAA